MEKSQDKQYTSYKDICWGEYEMNEIDESKQLVLQIGGALKKYRKEKTWT